MTSYAIEPAVLDPETTRSGHPLGAKMLTQAEIDAVRVGTNGVKGMMPARTYYDEDMYRFEVDHILKKQWLVVGRWDDAKEVGDWFTRKMFGESILIVRDRKQELHAFINVCRHRWARLVEGERGNSKLLMCNYHSWTYELDGRLRGVAVQELPGFDKKNCKLNELKLEVWQGYIFINFDPEAESLNEQLTELTELVKDYQVDTFVKAGHTSYDTSWNYKFSFETGYETYHHEGVHRDIMSNTSTHFHPYKFGKMWGTYKSGRTHGEPFPYKRPPWLAEDATEDSYPDYYEGNLVVAIYPSTIMVFNPHRVMTIFTEHLGIDANQATTAMSIAPWALERHPEQVEGSREMMIYVAGQDAAGCRMLQAGITSRYNTESFLHPLERQLSHYYEWYVDQYLAAQGS